MFISSFIETQLSSPDKRDSSACPKSRRYWAVATGIAVAVATAGWAIGIAVAVATAGWVIGIAIAVATAGWVIGIAVAVAVATAIGIAAAGFITTAPGA